MLGESPVAEQAADAVENRAEERDEKQKASGQRRTATRQQRAEQREKQTDEHHADERGGDHTEPEKRSLHEHTPQPS